MIARRWQRNLNCGRLRRSRPSPTTDIPRQFFRLHPAVGPSFVLQVKTDAGNRSLAPLNRQFREFLGPVQAVHDSTEEERDEKMEARRRTGVFLVLACTMGSLGLLFSPVVQGRESPSMSFVKKTIAAHSIVIFSKSYCPYCKRAKSVFQDLNEAPFVVELDMREDGPKIQEALSLLVKRHTVPQVFIDGEHIGGSDDTMEAYRTGRLKQLLGFRQSGEQDLR